MLKIKDIYNKLEPEKEAVFQVKNKETLRSIYYELLDIFKNKMYHIPICSLKDTYLILANWRDGMFWYGIFKDKKITYEKEFDVLADTKESPTDNTRHREQIEKTIKIMDKHREDITYKRLEIDTEKMMLVEKVKEK